MDINTYRFFDLSLNLLCVTDYSGHFKYLSPAWEEILGYPRDIILSNPYLEFVHPDDIKRTKASVERLTEDQTETIAFENRYRCKNGNYVWLTWKMTVEKQGKLLYCAANDITSLKVAQNALNKVNFELRERLKELKCLYVISNLLSYHEKDIEEAIQIVLGQIPLAWQYPKYTCARIILYNKAYHTENFRETIWKLVSDIKTDNEKIGSIEVSYLMEMPKEDIGPFLKEEKDLIYTISKIIGEFCSRSGSAEALRQSEEQHRILVEHIDQGIFVIQNNKLRYVNNLFSEMVGYSSPDTLIGQEVTDILADNYKKAFLNICSEVMSNESKREVYQGKLVSNSGRQFWVEGHLSYAEWLKSPSIIATLRDIETSKEYEFALENEASSFKEKYVKLKSTTQHRYRFGNIIGKSPSMQEVYELITEASASESPVIIWGETGTGKEEVARMIHMNSTRSKNGFVPVNCGAIPDTLFESEFFGYKKGAFTGAHVDKHGFFDLAHKGSLFLDEVGEMAYDLQVKLLRALETGEYTPVGDNTFRRANVRIISATNVDLAQQVENRQMREDFYYRIHVLPIYLPPLRERKEDIPLLANHFLEKYSSEKGENQTFSGKELDWLGGYSWPGNIRELQNVVQRFVSVKSLDFFSVHIPKRKSDRLNSPALPDVENCDLRVVIKDYEKQIILKALEKNCWKKGKTAISLGVSRRTFFRKLEQLGLEKNEPN